MDIKRIILFLALVLLGVALWNAWQRDYPPPAVKAFPKAEQTQTTSPTDFVPPTYKPGSVSTVSPQKKTTKTAAQQAISGRLIRVKTDLLEVAISTKGGNLVSAKLLKYPVSLKPPAVPTLILNKSLNRLYIAQSGLTSQTTKGRLKSVNFEAAQYQYQLQPGQNQLVVRLSGSTPSGLEVNKIYTFKRNHYVIKAQTQVKNASNKTWIGSFYNQIVRRNVKVKKSLHTRSYNGAAISSPEKPYEKLHFKKLVENNVSRNIKGGWIAMQQQYFLSTWIPEATQENHYYSHVIGPTSKKGINDIFTVGYVSPQVTLMPGQVAKTQSKFYVGPEVAKRLKQVAKGLELTIDYGWLSPISKIIFWAMDKIHSVIGNWGWSIILTTILIKLLFYKLSEKSYRSMAKMRAMQPRIAALKERLGDDKQALSKATMELYRKEKANPMGGCLPMLIQIPVFIALYYVLIESVQLRQAPFIFWIQDLSVKDPIYVLPLLMGVSMFIQQKISPPPPDPMQAKVMMYGLPVIFTVFFATFPAGLVLYWLVNNCISILQQWYIMKTFDPNAKPKAKKKKKKKR